MLNRLPTQLPPFSLMLADLGHPAPRALGRALGVHPRTVARWIAADHAPRPVLLALFWLTRWGLSLADAEVFNAGQLAQAQARAQAGEVQRLRRELARVLALGDYGSANAPTLESLPPAGFTARNASGSGR